MNISIQAYKNIYHLTCFINIISELDMLELIYAIKFSRGRYGLIRKIIPNIPPEKYITKIQ
jgi:hypothetical protein